MTEMIFQFDRSNYTTCQERFRGVSGQDYYEGDYAIDPAESIHVIADKKEIGASAIIRLRSCSRMSFRRAWRHIRHDGIDLSVLWFVKHGSIRITAPGAVPKIAAAGDFLLTGSTRPFFMECLSDDERRHEVIHMTAPTHLIRNIIPQTPTCSLVIPGPDARIAMARHILEEVLTLEEGISAHSGRRLVEAATLLVGDVVAERVEGLVKKQTLTERRIEDVLRYIDVHLCNPNLNTAMVSRGCGIAPRYLSTLLQMHGTSFSSLVWEQRMTKAKDWLSSTGAGEVLVSEVAHGLGFKSVAHFSRRFKKVFHINPSRCRHA